jgi:hypothetical protein
LSKNKWRVWFQNAVNPFLCIREKCSQCLFGIYLEMH